MEILAGNQDVTLSEADMEAIRRAGALLFIPDGEVIFRIGEVGDCMYFILEGMVRLVFDGGKGSKLLGKPDFFGELAFVMGEHRRTATAVAENSVRLAVLDHKTVDQLLNEQPRLIFSILRKTCVYLLSSEQGLIADLKGRNAELRNTLDYLRRTKEELDVQELLARTDKLTGLYTRRCMDMQMEKHIRLANSMGDPLGLILADLDGFKPVNDVCGHPAGDLVLRQVAKVFQATGRRTDLPFRIGGDEFAILLPGMSDSRGPGLCESLRLAVEALPPVVPEKGLFVTASIGGTMYRLGETAAEFMDRVDKLLYQAKNEGRNRVVWSE